MGHPKQAVAQVFPPGDFIREELEARGWTQAQLAEILGRPLQLVNAIVNAKKEITPATAIALGTAFETGPEFWLNLESAYRLSRAGPADPGIMLRVKKVLAAAKMSKGMKLNQKPLPAEPNQTGTQRRKKAKPKRSAKASEATQGGGGLVVSGSTRRRVPKRG